VKNILYLGLFFFIFIKPAIGQTNADSSFFQTKDTLHRQKQKPPGKTILVADSLLRGDSLAKKGSAVQPQNSDSYRNQGLSYLEVLRRNTSFNFFDKPIDRVSEKRKTPGKETLFYLLSGLLFFFAIIKLLFAKYVNNLGSLVFRGSLKQKQIREQLLQTPLPSLLLNVFFVIVAGLYVLFLLRRYNFAIEIGFWPLLLYCSAIIGCIYLVKFIILKFTGWIFNMNEATDTYLFIVFLVNKLLGISLLPLLILIAFAESWNEALYTVSYVLVFSFFAYRYIISFSPVRREVKVSQFHFFMYLCAFEVIPLLLIYKVLLRFL
jgi:Domain of unknown function (DUF4271)